MKDRIDSVTLVQGAASRRTPSAVSRASKDRASLVRPRDARLPMSQQTPRGDFDPRGQWLFAQLPFDCPSRELTIIFLLDLQKRSCLLLIGSCCRRRQQKRRQRRRQWFMPAQSSYEEGTGRTTRIYSSRNSRAEHDHGERKLPQSKEAKAKG